MKVLITGCAGFIGFHLAQLLIKKNIQVIGIDNINNYYDTNLKKNRIKILKQHNNFTFYKFNLLERRKTDLLIKKNKIKILIHLAAQAGVRHSINNPNSYFKNNLEVFFNILEVSKINKLDHLLFASTSSVYGENELYPSTEENNTDKPMSFYAATKKSNELMAYSYSQIFRLPCTGLRFFTVYGPYGRPDMALFKFTKKILENKSIDIYNNGNHYRDFTYIDDVVDAIHLLIKKPKKNKIPFNIFNIGNGNSRKLTEYIKLIEKNLKLKAKLKKMPIQKADIKKTHSDVSKLKSYIKYSPKVQLEVGVKKFVEWYLKYYNV
jgi:UDP-glucuronate 4-epimerase